MAKVVTGSICKFTRPHRSTRGRVFEKGDIVKVHEAHGIWAAVFVMGEDLSGLYCVQSSSLEPVSWRDTSNA